MIEKAFKILIEKKLTFSSVESMSGGGLAHSFIRMDGASKVIKGSIVAYDDSTKINIVGIDKKIIDKHTSISRECSIEMAKKSIRIFNSDIGISITGNAGPDVQKNSIHEKGVFFISIIFKDLVISRKFNFFGSRENIIDHSIKKAIDLLLEIID